MPQRFNACCKGRSIRERPGEYTRGRRAIKQSCPTCSHDDACSKNNDAACNKICPEGATTKRREECRSRLQTDGVHEQHQTQDIKEVGHLQARIDCTDDDPGKQYGGWPKGEPCHAHTAEQEPSPNDKEQQGERICREKFNEEVHESGATRAFSVIARVARRIPSTRRG